MEMHLATLWESIADAIPDHAALTHGSTTRTWADYDDRSARLASAYASAGLGPDSKIGLFMYNCNEYQEAQYGAFKMRGVPININYRYVDEELHYLLDNSDAEAIVFHSSLGDRVGRVAGRLPRLKLLIEVTDGSTVTVENAVAYDDVIADHQPAPRLARYEDDIYMLYTGGTTGMPKGVMYTIGGLTKFFLADGFPILGLEPPDDAATVAKTIVTAAATSTLMVSIPCAPLMHGTGLWLGSTIPHLTGAHVVTLTGRSFDSHELLRTVEDRGVTSLTIVGNSFAKPILRALNEGKPDGTGYDTSTISLILSSGVMWTSEVKHSLLDRIPQAVLVDAMGSTEGSMGRQVTVKGIDSQTGKFEQGSATKVFTEDGREVEPGSDEIGMVAAGGNVPLGYYKDPEKSSRTFRVINGERYSFPGDFAKVADDGSLILLGRGNQVINTGGEKVFPEEVEEAIKRVDGVRDCLVVGVSDEKFGQAVTAVVSRNAGADANEATIISSVKSQLAGFKAPKSVVFVDEVPRSPSGKPDYKACAVLVAH